MLKNNLKFSAVLTITVILVLGLSISLQSLLAEWTAPTANPPAGNTDKPINESATAQTKLGNLSIGGNFYVGDGVNDVLFVDNATGNVGIGINIPVAPLDVIGVVAEGSPLAQNILFLVRGGGNPDAGKVWVEYGPQSAPLLVLEDSDNPPRIQFQQVGTLTEDNPEYFSWIGHAGVLSSDIAIMGGNVGIGTTNTAAGLKLDVAGKVGATEYCDEDGNNCTEATDLGGGGSAIKYIRSAASVGDKILWCTADYPVLMSCMVGDDSGTLFDVNPANRAGLGVDDVYLERVKFGSEMGCLSYDSGHDHDSYFLEIICANFNYEEI